MTLKNYKGFATAILISLYAAVLEATKTKIDLQWAICDENATTVLSKLGEAGKKPYKSNPITYYGT